MKKFLFTLVSLLMFAIGSAWSEEVTFTGSASGDIALSYAQTSSKAIYIKKIEVTIQFLSAKTNMPVCVCTAEGQGSTEADDIRKAINSALSPLFNKKH